MPPLHTDPLPQVLLLLASVLLIAKVGGYIAMRLRMPAVLGELGAGIVMGNAAFIFGADLIPDIRHNEYVAVMAELGVILLMFEVGVESTVRQIASVGSSAALSAILGVVAPFFLGWGAGVIFLPEAGLLVHVFIGATLCATSVGISARVLQDAGATRTRTGRTILGAAVLDDTMGLIVLAVVVGVITTGSSNIWADAGRVTGQAVAFLGGGLALGLLFSKTLYRLTARLQIGGMLLTVSLVLCFAFSYGAHIAGLAPIVGAFAAGLILEPKHQTFFLDVEGDRYRSLEDLLHPLSALFVPLFFVQTGAKVELEALLSPEALSLGLVLTVAAVLGKLACAAGVLDRRIDRWTVALGMIPRGEVGLIFAGIGAGLTLNGLPVITPNLYSAIIVMVILTTLLTPLFLARRLRGRTKDIVLPEEETPPDPAPGVRG